MVSGDNKIVPGIATAQSFLIQSDLAERLSRLALGLDVNKMDLLDRLLREKLSQIDAVRIWWDNVEYEVEQLLPWLIKRVHRHEALGKPDVTFYVDLPFSAVEPTLKELQNHYGKTGLKLLVSTQADKVLNTQVCISW